MLCYVMKIFAYLPPFISQILHLVFWTVSIFCFDGAKVKTTKMASFLLVKKFDFCMVKTIILTIILRES